ncbi:UNKNOWN [Stylonychia lemnae]|uniref:Uncharacterized protein n=1 Tax=Stylonychia lemnae TaxID=5949 RepID=A0A078AZL0_STYLE|nr:UNKNOWN [Stylonychia lemnae]|eukprot:CDW87536.1 UNKNOWN [Stylonychia lemnae]
MKPTVQSTSSAALQNKLKFMENDNAQLKRHILDLDQSLKINKQIIDSLLMDNSDKKLQTIITQMRQDNENLYSTIKQQFDEIQAQNSKILILEQVSTQFKKKEMENNQIFLDQILNMKQQIEKKSFVIDNKEKAFMDLYKFAKQAIPVTDKNSIGRIEQILQNKQIQDQNLLNMNVQQIHSIIKEKERLQVELDKALVDLDQLKTLLAKSTIQTLNTQIYDENGDQSLEVEYIDQVYHTMEGDGDDLGQGAINASAHFNQQNLIDQKLSKSFQNIVGKMRKKKNSVPGLDFSNLKQIKDYKDWYSYSKKLEDAIRLLREKINQLEEENIQIQEKYVMIKGKCETLLSQNSQLQEQLNTQSNNERKQSAEYSFSKDLIFDKNGNIDEQTVELQLQQSKNSQNWQLQQHQLKFNANAQIRKAKRNKSQATFAKKNLTLAIDIIEQDNMLKQQKQLLANQNLNDSFSGIQIKQNKSGDNQEDSPIREGDIELY